jgi:hypothetical protein
MEDFSVGVKIVCEPLYHPPVAKPNDDLILHFHQDAALPFPTEKLNSTVADYPRKINLLLFAVSCISTEGNKT